MIVLGFNYAGASSKSKSCRLYIARTLPVVMLTLEFQYVIQHAAVYLEASFIHMNQIFYVFRSSMMVCGGARS